MPMSAIAALEHLTGPSRGTVSWFSAPALDITLGPRRNIRVIQTNFEVPANNLIAQVHQIDHTYEIKAPHDLPLWVNGVRVVSKLLEQGDVIEFGEAGPLSRFRFFREDGPVRKTVVEILRNSAAYLKASRQPLAKRLYRAFCGLIRQLSWETTILFRIVVVIAFASLAMLAYQQHQLNARLQQELERGGARLDQIAAALSRTRDEALHAGDLRALREEIGQRLSSTAERISSLELRTKASGRVIKKSISSVTFLQGAYSFREQSSGRMLRHVVNDEGQPVVSANGRALLTLEGNGPAVEIKFTGTGFFVGTGGALITNRHVAQPWETRTGSEVLAIQDLEPVMTKLIAYLPGRKEAFPVKLLRASKVADVAVLISEINLNGINSLKLATAVPTAGDEVIVMGFPTGLRSMLAQSGAAFIERLQTEKSTDFWSVAARLAEAGYIVPLASRGIVGQATTATIVYDAETTHGGSGGPVLDINGDVVAVNTATVPGFGGSNFGVPAAQVRALLKEAGVI
jgi:serine protease Do